jgi:hypothetical protein
VWSGDEIRAGFVHGEAVVFDFWWRAYRFNMAQVYQRRDIKWPTVARQSRARKPSALHWPHVPARLQVYARNADVARLHARKVIYNDPHQQASLWC